MSCDWQLASPPHWSRHMDRSGMCPSIRVEWKQEEEERGRKETEERIGLDKVVRSEREEKQSRGVCGPKRRNTENR